MGIDLPDELDGKTGEHDWQRVTFGGRARATTQRQCVRCGLWETAKSRTRPCTGDESWTGGVDQ